MESQQQSNNRPWLFKKGQSGNPGGRPKGSKSLKEYAREYLMGLTEEERQEYFEGLDKAEIWRMAEGNPHQSSDGSMKVLFPKPIDDVLKDERLQEDQTTEEPS